MATEINVYDSKEFEQLIENKDYRIAKSLTDTILKNISGKKRHYHALTVNVESEQLIYDITVDRVDFPRVLENQISVFEKVEEYETCSEIVKALKSLSTPTPKRRGRPKKNVEIEK
jgi:hypothetical protein